MQEAEFPRPPQMTLDPTLSQKVVTLSLMRKTTLRET